MKCITQNFKRITITKKTISVVLAFLMISVAVPFVSVNAASPVDVSTWNELLTAVSGALTDGTVTDIIVGADLVANSYCSVNGNKNIVIESASGNTYTITRDIEYTGMIFGITVGNLTLKNVTLDGNDANVIATSQMVYMWSGEFTMNGATIQNVKANVGGGQADGVASESGTITMTNGAVIKNVVNSDSRGGLLISGNGILNMENSSVTNCTGPYSGGVFIGPDATFNMSGNSAITGNISNSGGVVVLGTFNLSGNPNISGNKKMDLTTACNVYLDSGKVVTAGTLTNTIHVGITTFKLPSAGDPVSITANSSGDWSSYFTSDNASYLIVNSGTGSSQVVQLSAPPAPTITATGNTATYLQSDTVIITQTAGISGIAKVEVKKDDGNFADITSSYTTGYTVTANGIYTFQATNDAGATATATITYDKLDSTKPVVNINSNGYTESSWTNNTITLNITNTTSNLGTTTFGASTDGTYYTPFSGTYEIAADSNTTYYFRATSDSGVVSDVKTFSAKFDKTAPTGKITIKGNDFTSFLNTITFGLFFKQTVAVTIAGADTLSGVKSIEYQKVASQSDYAVNGLWIPGSSFSVSPDEKFIVYAKITDSAGNVTIINSDGVVVYTDSALETTTALFNKDTAKPGYKDIPITINLNDNALKDIKNGQNTLIEGTDYTISGNIVTLKKEYLKAVVNGSVTLTFSFNPIGEVFANGDTPETAQLTINELVDAAVPGFTTDLSGENTYSKGDAATALTVNASTADGGNVTYQWYKSSANTTNGTAIAGATSVTFTPKTDNTGVLYYYVAATNTSNSVNGDKSTTAMSCIYKVTVNNLEILVPVVSDNAPEVTLQNDSNYIEQAVLTDADKAKLAGGSDISIYLKVETTDAPQADKSVVLTALDGKTFGQYLDISLIKNIDGTEIKVSQTDSLLRITIAVPENLRVSGRTFSIVRVHNGVAVTLADLDSDPDTITIESDRFSTYAIVYTNKASKSEIIPNTGEHTLLIPLALLFGLGSLALALAIIKKRRYGIIAKK